MSKIEDDAYLKRSRATWLAEKLDINFARANAIMTGISKASPVQKEKISKAVKSEMRSSLHKKIRKPH
jgi:hypothetical protein